jgi:hypothetical protein
MNERIRELADQALKECDAAKERGIDQYSKRFAELIVRECVCLVLNGKYDDEKFDHEDEFHRGHNIALDGTAEGIKQHFGVAE